MWVRAGIYPLPVIAILMITACGEDETGTQHTPPDTGIKTESSTGSTPAPRSEAQQTTPPVEETAVDMTEVAIEPLPEETEEASPAVTVPDSGPRAAATGTAQTHTINAEARVFNPDIIYVQPGDTVGWINMTSHNTVSVEGLVPEGAKHWRGQLGENLKITLEKEGVYAYVCEPHIGFGMVGVIVAGTPVNLEQVKIFADQNLQGPYRRIIGKLNKVTVQ